MTRRFKNGLYDDRETTVNERIYRESELFEKLSQRI